MGSSGCVFAAPDHFTLDDGVALPIVELTGRDEAVYDAAVSCPTEAITIHDAAGTRLAP
jgi:ferredoxin